MFPASGNEKRNGNSFVILKCCDMMGREFTDLINEQLYWCTYQNNWNASYYPAEFTIASL